LSNSSPARSRLLLVGAAVLFSTGGAAIKMATLTEWQVASFRSGVAAAALLVVVPAARRGWSWRMVPASCAYAATVILFVLATRLTTAANAIFLQSTAPFYILIFGPLILHERVGRSDAIYVAIVAVGIACLFMDVQPALATAPDPRKGNLIALASGLAWAMAVMGLRATGRDAAGNKAVATVTMGNLIAFLAALPMALPVDAAGSANVATILYLGIVQIGVAYALLSRAIEHVPAFEATAVLLVEPVMNPIWAWLVHDERPGIWALGGGATILLATFANTWRKTRGYVPVALGDV
jgi:DME family drug/metabolite transporter